MIWTELTKKAYLIACHAHCGQVDKGGSPYIIHPCTLAAQMPTEETAAVALLHDVLEDSDVTEADLLEHGIPKSIVQTVSLLTRPPGARIWTTSGSFVETPSRLPSRRLTWSIIWT